MQVLCDLRPTFLKCNCQTPDYKKGYLSATRSRSTQADNPFYNIQIIYVIETTTVFS